MRRPSALILSLALVASTLFAGTFSAASAFAPVGIAHPGGDDGNLSTIPDTYNVGDQVELYANFASDQSGRTVTYYKETPAGSADYASVGTATANSNGNAYLKNYTVNAAQKIFARSSTGKVTEIQTLTPIVQGPVTPSGTVTGTLAEEPATYSNGDTIQLGANFASGTFPVTFYEEGPADVWTPSAPCRATAPATRTSRPTRWTARRRCSRARPTTTAPRSTPSPRRRRSRSTSCATAPPTTAPRRPPPRACSIQWRQGSP